MKRGRHGPGRALRSCHTAARANQSCSSAARGDPRGVSAVGGADMARDQQGTSPVGKGHSARRGTSGSDRCGSELGVLVATAQHMDHHTQTYGRSQVKRGEYGTTEHEPMKRPASSRRATPQGKRGTILTDQSEQPGSPNSAVSRARGLSSLCCWSRPAIVPRPRLLLRRIPGPVPTAR